MQLRLCVEKRLYQRWSDIQGQKDDKSREEIFVKEAFTKEQRECDLACPERKEAGKEESLWTCERKGCVYEGRMGRSDLWTLRAEHR